MLYRIVIISAVLMAFTANANAQESNIREIQFSEYLLERDFNGASVKEACAPNNGINVRFLAVADESNLPTFLDFLKLRPQQLSAFNRGQFSQTATAMRYAVENVCEEMRNIGGGAGDDVADTDFDPVIDVVNISGFFFEYRFQHDQPEGFLPLHRRNFPVVELDVDYADDNFPDKNGDVWVYQTAELIITVNNYEYFGYPGTGAPDGLQRVRGSLPCYYKHPSLRAVYRYAWEDCNPDTAADYAPRGVSLIEAVEALGVDFIEQNVDTAAPKQRAPDDTEISVCCRESRRAFGAIHYFTPVGECRKSASDRFNVVASRYCEAPQTDDPAAQSDARDDGRRYNRDDRSRDVCCRDYSTNQAEDFFAEKIWCEDQDDHGVVPDNFCRR